MPEGDKVAKVLSEVRRRPRVQTVNTEPSRTVQSDVYQSDIRHVLAKFREVGIVEHLGEVDLTFRDVTEFEDFADVMRQAKEAEKVFMKLPPQVRAVFDHDVARWLDCAHDPEKLKELRPELEKLGVVEAAPAVPPAAVPPAAAPA